MIRSLCFAALSAVFLTPFAATPVLADGLCVVTDTATNPAHIRGILAGAWTQDGAVSIETETLSVTQDLDAGTDVIVTPQGAITWPMTDQWLRDALLLAPRDVPLDVDTVDDLLDTTETAWIADAVGDTLCGPESLPQMSATFAVPPQAGSQDSVTGTLTLIPYFDDRVVLLAQIELRGDWGLGFVTASALLTR